MTDMIDMRGGSVVNGLPKCRAPFASDAELAVLTQGFLARDLPKPCWTHDAHWAVALDLMLNHPEFDLDGELPDAIRAYNEACGLANTDSSGYHETITRASIAVARHELKTGRAGRTAFEAVNDLLSSRFGKPGWLLEHWTEAVLMSPAARRTWIAPDVKPLPAG